jgi:hypothetical protein
MSVTMGASPHSEKSQQMAAREDIDMIQVRLALVVMEVLAVEVWVTVPWELIAGMVEQTAAMEKQEVGYMLEELVREPQQYQILQVAT